MRKAGNLVEMPIILGVVTVVAIGTLLIYNNQSIRMAVSSAINYRPVNLQTMTQDMAKQIVPYNKVETAGGNALSYYAGTDFESAITHINYGNLEDAFKKDPKSNTEGIDTYANNLIKIPELSEYKPLTETNITSQTLSDLVGILNVITKPSVKEFIKQHPKQETNVKGFLTRFDALLTAGTSNAKNTAALTNTSSSIAQTNETAGKNGAPSDYTYSNNNTGVESSIVAETGGVTTLNNTLQPNDNPVKKTLPPPPTEVTPPPATPAATTPTTSNLVTDEGYTVVTKKPIDSVSGTTSVRKVIRGTVDRSQIE